MTTIDRLGMNTDPAALPQANKESTGFKQLTSDNFITLFLTQLTKQNPLHPADSSTILQQMADISSLGASKDTQLALKDLQKTFSSGLGNSQLLAATQAIGKRIEIPSATMPLLPGEGLSGAVAVSGAATDIKVVIKNQKDEVIKELKLVDTASSDLVDFSWDGLKADQATFAEPGMYRVSATAMVNGKESTLNTLGAFKVKSVAADHNTGEVLLNVDGMGGIGINDIIKII